MRKTELVLKGGIAMMLTTLLACHRDDPNKLLREVKPVASCPPSEGPSPTPPIPSGMDNPMSSGSMPQSSGSMPNSDPLDSQVDYIEALRTAALKIVGNIPTLSEIENVRTAANQQAAYESLVDAYFADARFARRMVEFWKNTMRAGNFTGSQPPSLDTAPVFAARVTVEGLDFTSLFTAEFNTCPTFDPASAKFIDGNCGPNGPVTAGLLTDRGLLKHYYGPLAFRRVRFFQEVFACSKMPAEWKSPEKLDNGASYTSPWPFDSIAGKANGGSIDFLDYSSSVCANCHTTINHRVPLWAPFDENGEYQAPFGSGQDETYAVLTPLPGTPNAKRSDYLPFGQSTAWKVNVPAATLKELGQTMAKDPEVQACAVRRAWNYAMSKGDIVYDFAPVPMSVIEPLVAEFQASGFNLKKTLRSIFVHPDFVRF